MTLISSGDSDISKEKLISLINLKSEYDYLDYKEEWDLKGIHKMNALKTISAMSSNKKGGYIIIGVSNNGDVKGIPDKDLVGNPFDPSKLNQLYTAYTGNSGIISQVHKIENKNIVIIYVPRSPDYFSVMLKNANMDTKSGKPIFLTGDVFVRRGTSSVKWNKVWASEILEEIKSDERQKSLESYSSTFSKSLKEQKIILDSNFLSMSSEKQFLEIEQSNDVNSLTQHAIKLVANFFIENQSNADMDRNRRIFLNIASYLLLNHESSFDKILEKLKIKYRNEFSEDSLSIDDSRIALSIAISIESLGSLAVRYQRFDLVRKIANIAIHIGDYYKYSSWLRHAQVMASRNRLTPETIDPHDEKSRLTHSPLISGAIEELKHVVGLRPECRTDLEYESNKESLLDSIASFDFMWCLIALYEGGFT